MPTNQSQSMAIHHASQLSGLCPHRSGAQAPASLGVRSGFRLRLEAPESVPRGVAPTTVFLSVRGLRGALGFGHRRPQGLWEGAREDVRWRNAGRRWAESGCQCCPSCCYGHVSQCEAVSPQHSPRSLAASPHALGLHPRGGRAWLRGCCAGQRRPLSPRPTHTAALRSCATAPPAVPVLVPR